MMIGKVNNFVCLAQAVGCRVGALPSSYLRLPSGAPFRSVSEWDNGGRSMGLRVIHFHGR